ncbi:MAG TPA: HemK2/MTQ2 family protein methyltransferase [Candidatus Thermoplasmatota archaeon]
MVEGILSGLRYATRDDVYDPHDDTELLIEAVRAKPGEAALDLGCGAGLVGIQLRKLGARVVCSDLNESALRLARENAKRNNVDVMVARTDLTKGLRLGRFDVVAFNPPYLPTTPEERLSKPLNYAFDGGDDGLAPTNRFLDECQKDPPGRVFIIGSNLQGNGGVEQSAHDRGMRVRVACTKNLSWETLTVYDLSAEEAR